MESEAKQRENRVETTQTRPDARTLLSKPLSSLPDNHSTTQGKGFPVICIDSHHHLWTYDASQYPWIDDSIDDSKSILKRSFLVDELNQVAQDHSIERFITVQARQSLVETRDLLAIAATQPRIAGVVGWVPFADPDVAASLETFAANPLICGMRHVVQDEPDDRFLDRADFNRGIRFLAGTGLVFDLLVFPRQLPAAIDFADRHPDINMVLDHIAKPAIRAAEIDHTWERDFRDLARRPHVACKFSGLATEVRDEQWSLDTIRPYWDIALDAFGTDRLMYGSDWPVCLLATTYARWLDAVTTLASSLSDTEQQRFFAQNADQAYSITAREDHRMGSPDGITGWCGSPDGAAHD